VTTEHCYEHGESYDGEKYSSCYQCYTDRREDYVDCIFCGRWHSPKFNTCFKCRQIVDRDEAARNLRLVVMARDSFTCQYCGDTEGVLHIDHVKPCAEGGTADVWNLQVLCAECNREKGRTWYIGSRHNQRRNELIYAYWTYLWPYLTPTEKNRLQSELTGVSRDEVDEALIEHRKNHPRKPLTEVQKDKLQLLASVWPAR
jgi:5-methylcytosine-specific restriction endonuclease McrA